MSSPSSLIRIGLAALAVAIAAPTAAHAQSYYGPPSYQSDPRVDRYSGYAREGVGAVYGNAGRRVCGYSCGRAARDFGRDFYDNSRRFSVEGGRRLQEYGRDLRRPRRCYGSSVHARSTPQYCH